MNSGHFAKQKWSVPASKMAAQVTRFQPTHFLSSDRSHHAPAVEELALQGRCNSPGFLKEAGLPQRDQSSVRIPLTQGKTF